MDDPITQNNNVGLTANQPATTPLAPPVPTAADGQISFSNMPDSTASSTPAEPTMEPTPTLEPTPESTLNSTPAGPAVAAETPTAPPTPPVVSGSPINTPTLEETGATGVYPTAVDNSGLIGQPLVDRSIAPDEVKGLNFGAFFFSWIWGISNDVWISLLALIPGINVIIALILLFKGNEWAWQKRQFESVDEFKKVQKIWSFWALGFLLAMIILGALTYKTVGPALSNMAAFFLPASLKL